MALKQMFVCMAEHCIPTHSRGTSFVPTQTTAACEGPVDGDNSQNSSTRRAELFGLASALTFIHLPDITQYTILHHEFRSGQIVPQHSLQGFKCGYRVTPDRNN